MGSQNNVNPLPQSGEATQEQGEGTSFSQIYGEITRYLSQERIQNLENRLRNILPRINELRATIRAADEELRRLLAENKTAITLDTFKKFSNLYLNSSYGFSVFAENNLRAEKYSRSAAVMEQDEILFILSFARAMYDNALHAEKSLSDLHKHYDRAARIALEPLIVFYRVLIPSEPQNGTIWDKLEYYRKDCNGCIGCNSEMARKYFDYFKQTRKGIAEHFGH